MNSRREFLFAASALMLGGCGSRSIGAAIPGPARGPEVRALDNGYSLVIGRSRTRAALVGPNRKVLTMTKFSSTGAAVRFAAPSVIKGRVPVRTGSVTNLLSTGDSFRIHSFGMGEWTSADGSYFRILDLQDGTSVLHAPSLGLRFKRMQKSLSSSPFPSPLPRALAVATRKAMSLTDENSGDPTNSDGADAGYTTTYDDYGDSLTDMGGDNYLIDAGGSSSDAYFFDTANLYDDFGTDTLDANMDGYTTLASTTVSPMTDECKAALHDLNVAFLNFIGIALSVAALTIATGRFKIKRPPTTSAGPGDGFSDFSASFGDPAQLIGNLLDLNGKQNIVDNACAGQGAGRRPYG